MVALSTKWDGFGTSIFSVMTQRANAAGAVNLAQGFPDFDGPEEVKEAAIRAIERGMNQYAPAPGLPELRQLLATRRRERYGMAYDWESEVTVYSGATEALYCALNAFLGPGDEVIALEPTYDSYGAAAHAAGARLVGVPLAAPAWRLDPAALRRAVTPRTRAILINTPHNPTGRVLTAADLAEVRDLAVAHDLIAITDEVYDELVYAPSTHLSLASLPGMRERTVAISSGAKTFSFTGWKVGYAYGPPALTKAMRALHQFTVFCSATPLQAGMIQALKLPETFYEDLRREYRQRRDQLAGMLRRAGFGVNEPEGTYFVLADYSGLKPEMGDVDFAMFMTEEVKVAAIPMSVFYGAPPAEMRHVRFAFCKRDETLQAAEKNLIANGAALRGAQDRR